MAKVEPGRDPQMAERTRGLNLVFALSSIALLLAFSWMIYADYNREWKKYQLEFNKLDVTVTEEQIEKAGAKVDARKKEAIEAQLAQGQQEVLARAEEVRVARADPPDLVLMDLVMPRMDGFAALEALRGDHRTAEIPVIFVSGRGDDVTRVRGLDLGAVDFLAKPFSERELKARIERTLRLARRQTQLRELAQTDALTGLANLRASRARLEEEGKRAQRHGTPLTCVMADMDNLKPVNDELGHAVGDRAIATVAEVIRDELRETDFGARYGGGGVVLPLPPTAAGGGGFLPRRTFARVPATAGNSPAWICGSAEPMESNIRSTSRARIAVIAGPLPLYGTWVMSTPTVILNSSTARWLVLPGPAEA